MFKRLYSVPDMNNNAQTDPADAKQASPLALDVGRQDLMPGVSPLNHGEGGLA